MCSLRVECNSSQWVIMSRDVDDSSLKDKKQKQQWNKLLFSFYHVNLIWQTLLSATTIQYYTSFLQLVGWFFGLLIGWLFGIFSERLSCKSPNALMFRSFQL